MCLARCRAWRRVVSFLRWREAFSGAGALWLRLSSRLRRLPNLRLSHGACSKAAACLRQAGKTAALHITFASVADRLVVTIVSVRLVIALGLAWRLVLARVAVGLRVSHRLGLV